MAATRKQLETFILMCIVIVELSTVVVQCRSDEEIGALRDYLAAARQHDHRVQSGGQTSEEQLHQLVRRLPPLVPPSMGDDEPFEEERRRQVFSIPRVGKSISEIDEELYAGADEDEFTGPGRGMHSVQVRQVFSKIPRVGRSATRMRRNARA